MNTVIENWPSGPHRVTATFSIETDAKPGQRAVRVTTGAPKKLTYAKQMRIVDGSDGRTYIAELSFWGHVTITRDMEFTEGTVFEDNPRYPCRMCTRLADAQAAATDCYSKSARRQRPSGLADHRRKPRYGYV
jgi:hypothetical protein